MPAAPVLACVPSRDAERMTVAAGAELSLPPPPPQDATPAKTADTIIAIKTFRTFIMSISLRSVGYAVGIADCF